MTRKFTLKSRTAADEIDFAADLNDEQLAVALTYVELYLTQTKDVSGYTVLLRKFAKKKQELGL